MAEDNKRGPIGNIISIVVIIAIVAIGLWGATALVRATPSFFSSFNLFGADELALTNEQVAVESEVPFSVAWEDDERSEGSYVFAYQCVEGISVSGSNASGTYAPLACDSPHQISLEARSLSLVARSTLSQEATVLFALAYIVGGEKEAEVSGVMTIAAGTGAPSNGGSTTTPPVTGSNNGGTQQPTKPTQPKPQVVNLAIQNVQVGWSDGYTFAPKSSFTQGEMAAVRFRVTNTGTVTSGTWRVVADLPTNPVRQYVSDYQRGLRPQESFDFTVRFDHLLYGTNGVAIRVEGTSAETSTADNYATPKITVY